MKLHVTALLVIRILGLGVVIYRTPDLMGEIGRIMSSGLLGWLSNATFGFQQIGYFLADIGILLQFSLGLYMVLGGKRLARLLLRGLPGVPGICERCGYDIAGLEGGRCPECGAKLPERQ